MEIRHFVVNANMAVPDNPNFERHDKIFRFFFLRFKGGNTHFHFITPFLKWLISLKEKDLLPWEQILSFKSILHFKRSLSSRETNRKSQSCSAL